MSSNLDDYKSIGEIDDYFSKKISLLNECMELKRMDPETAAFLRNFENAVVELRGLFQQLKFKLNEGQNQLAEMKEFYKKLETLSEKLDHMEKNLPSVLKPQVAESKKTEAAATPCVPKKTKIPANIECITVAEFESIPKYMKGRLQYKQINDFIDAFNKTISAKYKFLSVPRKQMKPSDFKIANAMKLQENEETKGRYFCTAENMKEYGNIRIEKSTTSFISILRHCKRIKEIRGPGALTRYMII